MVKENKRIEEAIYCDYYCDLCGNQIFPDSKIEYQDDESYNCGSDGGYIKEYVYDICKDCIKDIVFPYLKKITKKEPRVYESEW